MPPRELRRTSCARLPAYALLTEPQPAGAARSDAELLDDTARGGRAAFGALYNRLAPSMLALAYRMLGARREAEDLVHDVFLECWRSAAQYDAARGEVGTWFLLRTRSRALDRLRAARRAALSLDHELMERLPAHAVESGSPREASALHGILLQLSIEQRAVVELGYFAGCSHAEISRALAIPVGTVKSRMSRALEQLRLLLEERGRSSPE